MNYSTISKSSVKSVAIGSFDGIHKGHKELIKKLLLSGEISALADTITELTGYKGDLIEEVKN